MPRFPNESAADEKQTQSNPHGTEIIPKPVEKSTFGKASAPDLQQAKPMPKQPNIWAMQAVAKMGMLAQPKVDFSTGFGIPLVLKKSIR